jgi:hypothetical protein
MFFDLAVYAILIFGFPFGVLVGYMWRDRISQARRARYLRERGRARRVIDSGAAEGHSIAHVDSPNMQPELVRAPDQEDLSRTGHHQ